MLRAPRGFWKELRRRRGARVVVVYAIIAYGREQVVTRLKYGFLAEHGWMLDGLRGEQRFGALLDRVSRTQLEVEGR